MSAQKLYVFFTYYLTKKQTVSSQWVFLFWVGQEQSFCFEKVFTDKAELWRQPWNMERLLKVFGPSHVVYNAPPHTTPHLESDQKLSCALWWRWTIIWIKSAICPHLWSMEHTKDSLSAGALRHTTCSEWHCLWNLKSRSWVYWFMQEILKH